ncbi:VOC family protein [Microlunatus ginsengisoli]|jgi:catechol 2,3-dioxygenase-like lactoylglutathione lyase family enzyme|uniref:VOC domain-containing protein n=1 Tax=Microlunatus ginsengisoli TaxID=363863 RepID=A0ABP6ZDM4_9ACTN
MVTFAGVAHVAFTVTDLDVSQRFYAEVLDFVPVMDVGYGRILMHPGTGFGLALLRHEGAHGGRFTELTTGVDHLGFVASSREELEQWERRFDEHGVTYTPIRDMELGSHLNFRDPDNIALELTVPNELMITAQQALASGQAGPAEIAAFVAENLDPALVPR